MQALEKNCKAPGGYTGIKNVYQVDGQKDDVQQSFFLAESLKVRKLLSFTKMLPKLCNNYEFS